jgi:hypothetical protein
MEGDLIGGPTSDELEGARVVYAYSTGRRYHVGFDAGQVSFALEVAPGTVSASHRLPYRARKIGADMFLVHWLSPSRDVHVALLLDLAARTVHVSGVLPGKLEFFDIATIESVALRPRE